MERCAHSGMLLLLAVLLLTPAVLAKSTARRAMLTKENVAAMDYVSLHPPPVGFPDWVNFAKERRCTMGPYERIEKDLNIFRDTSDPQAKTITRRHIEEMVNMRDVTLYTVANGTLDYQVIAGNGPQSTFRRDAASMARLIDGFKHLLPDMQFVVNFHDGGRLLPGDSDTHARFSGPQCQNASRDFQESRHLHGLYHLSFPPLNASLPLFSQSKINECLTDITFPTMYNLNQLLGAEQQAQLWPWADRRSILFFRGSTSGAFVNAHTNYSQLHRQRLVSMGKLYPNMDMKFTSFIQCADQSICNAQRAEYGQAGYIDEVINFEHKYLMSVDGNSFVSRLPRFLSSGSLVFRAGLYSEWYDEWLKPYEHYIPVKLDYSDLESQLQWAMQNDDEARLIAQRARQLAYTRLRNEDISCYLFRVLLEYAQLWQG